MGFTRKVLGEKELDHKPVFYTDSFRIDLCESLHIHYRNFRLELSLEEWKEFAKGIIFGYLRWLRRSKPGYQKPVNNILLYGNKIWR